MHIKRFLISLPLFVGTILFFTWSELVWFSTQLSDTPEAYANYVEAHPNSEHNELALACLDELEWRLTESYAGALGYEYYLDRLPEGPHAQEARDGLHEVRLAEALKLGTLESVAMHTAMYPDDEADQRVMELVENLEWEHAITRNLDELFRAFLERFPVGDHAESARQKLALVDYRSATMRGTKEAWETYIKAKPPEEFLVQARQKLDELAWEEVAASPSVEGVRSYLDASISERYRGEAQDILEQLVWSAAQDSGVSANVRSYLAEFPKGLYRASALINLEGIAWSEALSSGTPAGLDSYLSAYPEGAHVHEVPVVREGLYWTRALALDQLKDYENYLERFPEGIHSSAARAALVPVSIDYLMSKGELQLSISNVHTSVLELSLALTADLSSIAIESSVTIDIPLGLMFVATDPSFAELVVVRPARLRLRYGEEKRMRLNVASIHGLRVGPSEQYAAAPKRDEELASILVKAQEFAPAVNPLQVALRIALDDMDFAALSALRGPSGKPIRSAVIAEGMDLCRKLGLIVSRQRIWSDRSEVRAALPAGKLRKWLSQPESVAEAIRFGNVKQLGRLLDQRAAAQGLSAPADDSLALAFELDRYDMAVRLMESGATIASATPAAALLGKASEAGRAEWVQLLIEAGAKPAQVAGSSNELLLAVTQGEVAIIDLLLDAGAPLNGLSEYEVPLNRAAAAGQLASVRHLVERKAQVDKGVDTALMLAAENGHTEVLRYLIDAGSQIDRPGKWGYTALHKAIEHGQLACVELLLHAGSDMNRDAGGFRPIDLAALHSMPLVQFLDAMGAEETLFSCVALGQVDGIERCLAQGESLERWGTGAQRPMHVAVRMRQELSLERLLGHGADVSARSTEGLQPLHMAVQMAWSEGIEILVAKGADLDDAGYGGTPLQIAVGAGDLSTAELLLSLGADPARKRAQDPSALDQARAAAQQDPGVFQPIVKLLERYLED